MQRILLGWTALGLLALAAGCTLCASPYDYCGPTFTGEGCGDGSCDPRLRSGSILAPADTAFASDEFAGGTVISEEIGPGQIISSDDQIIEQGGPMIKPSPGPTPAKAPKTTVRPQVRR